MKWWLSVTLGTSTRLPKWSVTLPLHSARLQHTHSALSCLDLPRYHLQIAHLMMSTSNRAVLSKASHQKNKRRESWHHPLEALSLLSRERAEESSGSALGWVTLLHGSRTGFTVKSSVPCHSCRGSLSVIPGAICLQLHRWL